MQKRPSGRGLCSSSHGPEKAGWDLERGGRASEEGLGDSFRPCARGLSVAGFFDCSGLFPGSGWFILRGRKALFAPQDPFLLQQPGINCHHRVSTRAHWCVHDGHGRLGGGGGTPTWDGEEAYTQGGGREAIYPA